MPDCQWPKEPPFSLTPLSGHSQKSSHTQGCRQTHDARVTIALLQKTQRPVRDTIIRHRVQHGKSQAPQLFMATHRGLDHRDLFTDPTVIRRVHGSLASTERQLVPRFWPSFLALDDPTPPARTMHSWQAIPTSLASQLSSQLGPDIKSSCRCKHRHGRWDVMSLAQCSSVGDCSGYDKSSVRMLMLMLKLKLMLMLKLKLKLKVKVKGIAATASTSTCSSRHTAVSTNACPCYAAAAADLIYSSTDINSYDLSCCT
ncbi:hypothetical protein EDD21DRAFT_401884 [Dissophora ornata]|nr:hypothetical protein EDD21DRAFT_401884 [Dissophora ornata]